MLTYRRGSGLLAVLLLWGCADAPPYVAPSSGETATVTFVNEVSTPLSVQGYKVGLDCRGPMTIASRMASKEQTTAQVPAGQEWSFGLFTRQDNMTCSVIHGFFPEKGASYRVAFRINPDGRTCGAVATRTDSGAPVQLRRKTPRQMNTMEDPGCSPG